MKFLPYSVALACAAVLVSCSPKQAGNPPPDQETQARLTEDQLAREQSQLQEQQAALDERESVLKEREQQLAAASPAPAQEETAAAPVSAAPAPEAAPQSSDDASEQMFYDALSQYGAWIEMAQYGYVWQPSAARDANWRPYTLGNFAWTNAGWTWMSNEPFGWITYHYGRWMRTQQLGWVWFPGDQWAPAWVSWRYGNDFVGWAPLPPEAAFDGAAGIQQWADQQYNLGESDYTFVPASEFGDENMADVEVPPDQTEWVYDESNNVTDIYWDAGTYEVICYGPNYDFLRTKVRRPLLWLNLKRGGFRVNGNNRAFVNGNTLQVPAPRIVRGERPPAPRTIRERVTDTRQVSAANPPHAADAPIPPSYHPPETANGGMHIPSQMNPVPASRAASGEQPREMRGPVQTNPAPDVEARKARDLQDAQEKEAADQERANQDANRAADQERARQDADRAAEEQRQADQGRAEQDARAAAAEHAAAEHAAAEQARADRAAREESARQGQLQPSVPANTQQPGGPGRNQQ